MGVRYLDLCYSWEWRNLCDGEGGNDVVILFVCFFERYYWFVVLFCDLYWCVDIFKKFFWIVFGDKVFCWFIRFEEVFDRMG